MVEKVLNIFAGKLDFTAIMVNVSWPVLLQAYFRANDWKDLSWRVHLTRQVIIAHDPQIIISSGEV